jgi:GDP-D-mannose dehydratase
MSVRGNQSEHQAAAAISGVSQDPLQAYLTLLDKAREAEADQFLSQHLATIGYPCHFRAVELDRLRDVLSKAKAMPGWVPKIATQQMCDEMVAEDMKAAQRHAFLASYGD